MNVIHLYIYALYVKKKLELIQLDVHLVDILFHIG